MSTPVGESAEGTSVTRAHLRERRPQNSWVSRGVEKVPTKWILSGAVAVVVAATAVFGGLNDAQEAQTSDTERALTSRQPMCKSLP